MKLNQKDITKILSPSISDTLELEFKKSEKTSSQNEPW